MPKFIAIPVGQGDAFYLDRGDFTVLVDGGKSTNGFPRMFQTVTERSSVDVVVCTHNDADHANGILGYLESGLTCQEIWLPGKWLDVLPDVLEKCDEVANHLALEILDITGSPELERLLNEFRSKEAEFSSDQDQPTSEASDDLLPEVPLSENGWPESCVNNLEQSETWWFPHSPSLTWRALQWRHLCLEVLSHAGLSGEHLFWSALEAAERIRAIAIAAFHGSIRVRWFEHQPGAPSGGTSALQPVNAREITRVRPRAGSLVKWLALSAANKQSLVFWSPPAESHAGVLFTADSDLAGLRLPNQSEGALITAPHHGSEANAHAYDAVASALRNPSPSITWVRSDGRFRSRPGDTYLAQTSRRICTLCRRADGNVTGKQSVRLFSRRRTWTRNTSTKLCVCE